MMLVVAVAGLGQEQQNPIEDLNLLVRKQVTVQRKPLCQPGTFTVVLSYAGKPATVVSLKPSKITPLSPGVMARMPQQARAMMEDAQKAATILLQFEDGTQLDTCAPIGPNKVFDYIELAPGETVVESVAPQAPSASPVTKDMLSDDEVKLAVSGKGKDHFVWIQDMGLMAAQGNQVPTITLYMPEALLSIRAEAAKKQFTRYNQRTKISACR